MTTPPEPQDRLSPIPLRERLAAAKLSGLEFGMYGGFAYSFRSNEQAADEALIVVRDWLNEAAEGLHAAENAADIAGLFADQRTVLHGLADAIDKELSRDS